MVNGVNTKNQPGITPIWQLKLFRFEYKIVVSSNFNKFWPSLPLNGSKDASVENNLLGVCSSTK